MSDLSDAQLAMLRKQLERWRDNPTVIGAAGLGVNFGVVMDEVEALRADLAKAQAESEAAAKRWDEENASLAAQLVKAQARCAELEAALRANVAKLELYADPSCCRGSGPLHEDACVVGVALVAGQKALASDGTSALAAVRLAQRLVKMVTPPKERPADLGLNRREKLALEVEKALTEAFGSGE